MTERRKKKNDFILSRLVHPSTLVYFGLILELPPYCLPLRAFVFFLISIASSLMHRIVDLLSPSIRTRGCLPRVPFVRWIRSRSWRLLQQQNYLYFSPPPLWSIISAAFTTLHLSICHRIVKFVNLISQPVDCTPLYRFALRLDSWILIYTFTSPRDAQEALRRIIDMMPLGALCLRRFTMGHVL